MTRVALMSRALGEPLPTNSPVPFSSYYKGTEQNNPMEPLTPSAHSVRSPSNLLTRQHTHTQRPTALPTVLSGILHEENQAKDGSFAQVETPIPTGKTSSHPPPPKVQQRAYGPLSSRSFDSSHAGFDDLFFAHDFDDGSDVPHDEISFAHDLNASSVTTGTDSHDHTTCSGLSLKKYIPSGSAGITFLYEFRQFLAREHSEENLDFLLWVQEYHERPTRQIRNHIYKTYVQVGSFKQVNLDDWMVRSVHGAVELLSRKHQRRSSWPEQMYDLPCLHTSGEEGPGDDVCSGDDADCAPNMHTVPCTCRSWIQPEWCGAGGRKGSLPQPTGCIFDHCAAHIFILLHNDALSRFLYERKNAETQAERKKTAQSGKTSTPWTPRSGRTPKQGGGKSSTPSGLRRLSRHVSMIIT